MYLNHKVPHGLHTSHENIFVLNILPLNYVQQVHVAHV